jgi:heme-degrading monooxygenase HmoA
MFAVIFEVEPRQGKTDEYLQLAASLRPELEKIDGFLEIERFASERAAGRLLSLSIWRDEAALTRWRMLGLHRSAQQKGRSEIFADYRLRVGEIGAEGDGEIVTLSEFSATENASAEFALPAAGMSGMNGFKAFASLYNPGKRLLLVSWQDPAKANLWRPQSIADGDGGHRRVRVIRDYGMFDRTRAPQYYPPAPKTSSRHRRCQRPGGRKS